MLVSLLVQLVQQLAGWCVLRLLVWRERERERQTDRERETDR